MIRTPPVPLDRVTHLILQVFKLNGRLLAAGDRLVQDIGLTSARWQVLGAIALADTPQPVANIARAMGLSRQAVQRTVNELVTTGLLELVPNPHHQKASLVVLTKRGAAAYEAAHARQVPWARMLGGGVRESDLVTAERVLSELVERLETDRSEIKAGGRRRRAARPAKPNRRSHGQAG